MDFVVVGAGFYGATVAERLAAAGRKVVVIEKRPHIGGNSFSHIDPETGIEVHTYGSHIFHTSNEEVWAYIRRFTEFNNYRHSVRSSYKNITYPMPINLTTINNFYNLNLKPCEVSSFLQEACKESVSVPSNLEEKAISMIGRPLYEAFIKGYTVKQWGKDPKELSPDIMTRLPVRHNDDARYFSDTYEGIPLDGYGKLFERMLDRPNIEIRLNQCFFDIRESLGDIPILYTGPIDRLHNYKYGRLDWRTIELKRKMHDCPDFQGCAVINYADETIPYTRIHEYKHYHPERSSSACTVTHTEYSRSAGETDEPYYPINTPHNAQLLCSYLKEERSNISIGGRLGLYRYLDMDDTIAEALKHAEQILTSH
ncbi:MAG: UDP-galactopyranose mutase [bacterium]